MFAQIQPPDQLRHNSWRRFRATLWASVLLLVAACGGGGNKETPAASVPAPVITSFTNSGPVASGSAATLTAVYSGGTGGVDHSLGAIQSGVSLGTGNLTTATTYTLTVTNATGTAVTATTTVNLADASLAVTINGLGALPADVTVTGPASYTQHLTATQTLTGLAEGTYTITAATVTDATQPGLGRGNGGTLGPDYLRRYPMKAVQAVTASGGGATVTVDYPAATLTVQIPTKETAVVTVPMDFVLVPAGSFTMGSDDPLDSQWQNAQPPHTVTIGEAFYVAKTHLTQAQWKAVMGATNNPSYHQGDTFPVEQVSWDMIRTPSTGFLDQLNAAVPGQGFRLPSEAEYEYVCRAGTTTAYFFGADSTNLSTYANWSGTNSSVAGALAPNPWGLYDITGNVWHWLEDDGHNGYTGAPVDGSAWVNTPTRSTYRVLRGSSWYVEGGDVCRSAIRTYVLPYGYWTYVGFRLVLSASGTH